MIFRNHTRNNISSILIIITSISNFIQNKQTVQYQITMYNINKVFLFNKFSIKEALFWHGIGQNT